jgi:hypothetical protein
MSRNFGLRHRDSAWRSFWHEGEGERDPIWPFVVIGAAVALILGLGLLIA